MKVSKILSIILAIVLLIGCSGSKPLTKMDPVDELYEYANELKAEGAFAVVGLGQSSRMDLARDKAIADAQRLIGEAMNVSVESLKKRFIEEIGTEDPEVNEFFSSATKILSKAEYSGATIERTYRSEKKDKYDFFVVMTLNPEIVIKSIDDELKNRKLYERFRASEAFKELEAEVDKYEQSQNINE